MLKSSRPGITINNLASYFLIVILLASIYFVYLLIEPIQFTLLIACIIATVFYPMYHHLNVFLKNKSGISAIIMCIIITMIIIMPLTLLSFMVVKEAVVIYQVVEEKMNDGDISKLVGFGQTYLDIAEYHLSEYVELDTINIQETITNSAKSVTKFIIDSSAGITTNLLGLTFKFMLMLFTLFYLFKDGHKLLDKLSFISPLPQKYDEEIFKKFSQVSMASIYGMFGTALFQGFIGGVGFFIAGIDSPIFWGSLMVLFALIPFVGATAVWIPAVIVLYFKGEFASAVFLSIWGAVLVSSADNILRSYLIKGRINVHEYLTFISLLGGIFTFGPSGIILGPLVLTIFLTLLHIYEIEYKDDLSH
jgi:predicted PurR-regulated permease PerM